MIKHLVFKTSSAISNLLNAENNEGLDRAIPIKNDITSSKKGVKNTKQNSHIALFLFLVGLAQRH